MRITRSVHVAAPADDVWQLLGPGFAEISGWAALVTSSSPTPSGDGRACTLAVPGMGRLVERLTGYDEGRRSLTYVVDAGMPSVVRESGNTWRVEPTGTGSCRVTASASLRLAPWAAPLGPVLRLAIGRIESRTLADLRAVAEWPVGAR